MLNEKLLALNASWVELQSALGTSSRVVLCLDEGPKRTRLATLTRGIPAVVDELDSAEAVVQLLAQDVVDLLVVGEDPPDMSALALARYARGRPVTPKILILSQLPSPRKVLEAIRLGVTDYLLEPEQGVEEVFERMRRRLEQLNRQKLQVAMLTDLKRLLQETSPEDRAQLMGALKERTEAHRAKLGPMNRVLCADPDPLLRRQLCSAMAGLGLVPIEAAGANSALALLEEDGADLVLLSGSLPDLPLDESLENIHEKAGLIPVVLLANVEEADAAMTALRLGFADTVRKPVASLEQTAHRIARMLKDRRRELLAEKLLRELYRLMRTASESLQPETLDQVEAVFDDVVVLPASAMDDAATAPVASGAGVPASMPPIPVAKVEVSMSAGETGAPVDPAVRLTSGEFQIISEGRRPDVLEAESLPDTVVIRYIDDLLFPGASKQISTAVGAGQRLTPRVERSIFVRYGATATDQASLGYAHDLSLGGMFILSDAPPPVHTDLRIELQIPEGDRLERIRLQGRVMWHTNPDRLPPQGEGFGVQFTVMDKAASAAIRQLIQGDENPS